MLSRFFQLKYPALSKPLIQLKNDLKKRKKNSPKKELSAIDKALLDEIKKRTVEWNKNNITRTKAYLDYYIKHPDIHWALLAHMVSRNAGWSMTDLKGEFLSRLLSTKEKESFFSFIERGNWLIFQDAYPQLLIYEESIKRGKNLFYLLSHLHVSVFMEAVWSQYWKERDSSLLSAALIVNEQNYIESRVIQNQTYQKAVFDTLEFTIQDYLSLNHILFPYLEEDEIKLKSQIVHQFENLQDRITLGKRLYFILFKDQERLKMVEEWATNWPHSGSRKDYWPHLFHDIKESIPGITLKPRLQSCRIPPGTARLYSPKLEYVWKDVVHSHAEIQDWYKDWRVVYQLLHIGEQAGEELEGAYCKALERLELAAITKNILSIFE